MMAVVRPDDLIDDAARRGGGEAVRTKNKMLATRTI
jgi:hypothetical protein